MNLKRCESDTNRLLNSC